MEAILQPNKPNNWFYAFLIAVLLFVLCIIAFPPSCSDQQVILPQDNSKYINQITALSKSKDSLLLMVKRKDTSRTEVVIKYRWLKGKTDTVPCKDLLPQIVNVCDSIIYIDSTEISLLKKVISTDSLIIKNYQKVHSNDSLNVVALKKEVKKQKRQKKAIMIGGMILGAIAIVK